MRKHNGMRPQDIVVLAKLAISSTELSNKELSEALTISQSEISESLHRSSLAKLIDYHKKIVNKSAFLEFVIHGLKYVFPAQLGTMQRGYATAHSHPFMKDYIESGSNYIWPDNTGTEMGISIEPFYPNQTKAIKEDGQLYRLLALFDVLRVGKVREMDIAKKELSKIIQHVPES